MQREETRDSDSSFVHHKTLVSVIHSLFHQCFWTSARGYIYVRGWVLKDGQQRYGPCKGLEHSGQNVGT